VIEHGHARGARNVLVGDEEPAERGARAEHRQQARRDAHRADSFRLAVAGQVVVAADRNRDLLEALVGRPDVEVLSSREPVFGDPEAGRTAPEDREAARVLIRQRPQQQRARDAEDRAVRADADGQRDDRRGGKSAVSCKGTQREPHVLRKTAHRARSCHQFQHDNEIRYSRTVL